MQMRVIDVSYHNGAIQWPLVANQVDAAIIRCGYRGYGAAGSLAVDPNFRANIQGALAAGLPVGAYWCTQALSDEEALEEAAFCREILKPFEITYPVYLDSEWMEPNAQGRADQISKQRRTQYALTWMREMKTYGYAAGLYTGESWFTDYIDGPAIAAEGFEIWLAKWGSQPPRHQHMGWQYTQSEKILGVPTLADMSKFYVNYVEEASDVIRYQKLSDIPNNWDAEGNPRATIERLMNAKIINGDGSDPYGNGDIIDLSHDMVRTLIMEYRGGAFDKKLTAVGLPPAVEF